MSDRLYKVIKNYTNKNEYEFVDLLQFVNDKILEDNPKNKTIATRFSLVKKFLRNNYPDLTDKQLKLVRPDDEITNGILQNDAIIRSQKCNINFNKDLVNKILEFKLTDNIYELAIYLQFISGLRAGELIDSELKLRILKDNVRMMLSKKKNDKKNKYFPIKLINNTLTAKEFKNGINQIRAYAGLLKSTDWIKRINRIVKKNIRQDLTSHCLRGMYATYMFNTENPENQNINGFISKILNHESSDSSLNYSNYIYEQEIEKEIEKKVDDEVEIVELEN